MAICFIGNSIIDFISHVENEENIAESDPMLQEAGHILIDQIGLLPQIKNNQLVLINKRKAS